MLDIKGVKQIMKKLEKDKDPGKVEHVEGGRAEERYSYYLDGKMAFTFGLTRSSKSKSKRFYYVPIQMGLSKTEYRKLYSCSFNKKDLNLKLTDS